MIAYIPTIAALVQKPAAAQIIDSCCKSGGVLPKRATITVESTITTIVSPFTPNLSVRSPSTAPPDRSPDVRPHEHARGRRSREAEVGDDLRHPFEDEVERRDVEEVRERDDGRDANQARSKDVAHRALAHVCRNNVGSAVIVGCPMRAIAELIFSSAPFGCLRASQWTDSGTTKYVIGMSTAVTAAPK